MIKLRTHKKGDTLVEVLVASAILAVVLAGAYNLANRATILNQSAYERTRASNLTQAQAELLKAAHAAEKPGTISAWDSIGNNTTTPVAAYFDCRSDLTGVKPDGSSTPNINSAFYLNDVGSDVTYNDNQVLATDTLYNSWIMKSNNGAGGYYDFYVYTCWEAIGALEDQVSGTIIRLEDPTP